jgi:hypothetical protein
MALEQELKTYNLLRPQLVKQYLGLWALIKGDKLINAFDTYAIALKEAVRLFGTEPYFIKQILDPDPAATGLR